MLFSSRSRRAILRVTSSQPDTTLRFDAMLTLGRRRLRSQRITAAQTPFEIELPDADLSAVVRAQHDTDSMVVEYTLEQNGERRLYGRTVLPLAVVERRAQGILIGGLPASSNDASAA